MLQACIIEICRANRHVIRNTYYDANDASCLNTDGYAGQRYKFNDKNNLVELTCYGIDMEPCEVNGIITVKYEYNSRGEETKRKVH